MKINLEFNLPEEEIEFQCAKQGAQCHAALSDIAEFIRSERKYNFELSDTDRKYLEQFSDKFYEIVAEWGIEL